MKSSVRNRLGVSEAEEACSTPKIRKPSATAVAAAQREVLFHISYCFMQVDVIR